MKQWLKEVWCFFNGHDWTEHYQKRLGDYIYYADQTCGCCGYKQILKNDYAYQIKYLDKDGKILSDTNLRET